MDLQGIIDRVKDYHARVTAPPSTAPASSGFVLGPQGELKAATGPGFRLGRASAVQTPLNPRVGVPAAPGSQVPALRSAGLPTANMNRGFTMSDDPIIDTTATPVRPTASPSQIGYNPVRTPGPGIEGMGDFATEGLANEVRVSTGAGLRSVAGSIGRGALRLVRAATSPVAATVGGLASVAGMQSDATANSNGPVMGLRRSTPLFGGPGPGRAMSTNAISYTDPYSGAPVAVTQSKDQVAPASVSVLPTASAATPKNVGGWSPDALRKIQAANAPPVAAAPQVMSSPDEEGLRTEAVPTPLITEQTDASGVVPAALQSQVEIGGANGGFAFTRNADGTVDRLLSMRARTPGEDTAYADKDALPPQNQGLTVDKNGLPYGAVDTSPGSQADWAQNQQLDSMLNRPLGLKVWAQKNAQTIADATAQHYATEDTKTRTMLPLDMATSQSALQTAGGLRRKTAAEATGEELKNAFYPATVSAENALKAAQADQAVKHGNYFSAQGVLKDAQVSGLSDKLASAERIAAEKDATNMEKLKAAGEAADWKTIVAADPSAVAKKALLGGSREDYDLASQIAPEFNLQFQPEKPFKEGLLRNTKGTPARWVDATTGKPVDMAALVKKAKAARSTK